MDWLPFFAGFSLGAFVVSCIVFAVLVLLVDRRL